MLLNGQGSKKWPDAPTLKELGYTYEFDSPFGLAGLKGMDTAIVNRSSSRGCRQKPIRIEASAAARSLAPCLAATRFSL